MIKEGRRTEFVRVKPAQQIVIQGKTCDLPVMLHELKLTFDAKGALCLEGYLTLDWETYQRCLRTHAFGLTDRSRGEPLGEFEERDVSVQICLRQDLVPRCFSSREGFDEELLLVLKALQKKGDYLQTEEAWVFISVLQRGGELFEQGYRNTAYKGGSDHMLR